MSTEPWGWTAAETDAHTDEEIYLVRRRQAEKVREVSKADPVPPAAPDVARCGALWDYLISTGMSADEAEAAMRE